MDRALKPFNNGQPPRNAEEPGSRKRELDDNSKKEAVNKNIASIHDKKPKLENCDSPTGREPKSKQARNEEKKIENEAGSLPEKTKQQHLYLANLEPLVVDNVLKGVLNIESGQQLVVPENQAFIITLKGVLNILAGGKIVLSNNAILKVSMEGAMNIFLGGRLFIYPGAHLKVLSGGMLTLAPGVVVNNGISTKNYKNGHVVGNGADWNLAPSRNKTASIASGPAESKTKAVAVHVGSGREHGTPKTVSNDKEPLAIIQPPMSETVHEQKNGQNKVVPKYEEQPSMIAIGGSGQEEPRKISQRIFQNARKETSADPLPKTSINNVRENSGVNNGKARAKKEEDNKPVSENDILLELQPTPFNTSLTVKFQDVKTLDRNEYVNDTIIEFMLNHIGTKLISPEKINKVHLFDSFFFASLSRGIYPMAFWRSLPNESEQKSVLVANSKRIRQYKANKNIDFFAKDKIVMPIHESDHWMAAAVINPRGAIVEEGKEEEDYKAPKCYVVFYNSLGGFDPIRRMHTANMITGYLETVCSETKALGKKYGGERGYIFKKDRVIAISPKNAPIQPNFVDCGLHVLHFIEGILCDNVCPITVKDFPNFDWSKAWPEADKMTELMRDKIYNLLKKKAGAGRSRLEKFEEEKKCGLDREGALRKSRRHSAGPLRRLDRDKNYHRRSYTLNPPSRNLYKTVALFSNPRLLKCDPLYQKVQSLPLLYPIPPPKLGRF